LPRLASIVAMIRLLVTVLPNLIGAVFVYFYFTRVDPTVPGPPRQPLQDLVVFTAVTGTIIFVSTFVSLRIFGPLQQWKDRLRAGGDPTLVPAAVRRGVLNAPLAHAVLSMTGWIAAAMFYFPYQLVVGEFTLAQTVRVVAGILLVGGPVASAISFLVGEFYWRRDVPLFFPGGRLEHTGVLRVPILARLAATFLITAVLPPLLMMMVSLSLQARFGGELPEEMRPLWTQLLRTQIYIVSATGVVSVVMATLVARFINRPIQALRASMARVSSGDLDARVPVRSTDELGELNDRFNAMVSELRRAARLRELFGRYVSPAVARQALERGIALGGEVTRATAMFVDLRGFTALTERLPPARVVELLNEYYAIVERVCEREAGVITQFLGDGLVIVFGGPLRPLTDHARHAVRAAVGLQRALAERNAQRDGERLEAGIGICTGEMIAGNVGAGGRVTYTIVGDAVNQAARLQVKTRELGAPILVTESTRAALGEPDGIPLHARGSVPLKGVAAPVEVYSVEA
jgi:class 3 adenylate cyclase